MAIEAMEKTTTMCHELHTQNQQGTVIHNFALGKALEENLILAHEKCIAKISTIFFINTYIPTLELDQNMELCSSTVN